MTHCDFCGKKADIEDCVCVPWYNNEDKDICLDCQEEYEVAKCLLCGEVFIVGDTGNELGFCISCQGEDSFPYDLDKYYEDYDAGKVAFKGFETMSRGILEAYKK